MSNFLNQFTEKFKNYIDDNLMTTNEMQTKVISYLNTQEVKDQIIEQYLEDLEELPKRFRMEVEVSAGQVFTMWGYNSSPYTYDGTIDWGDGTVETFTTYNPSHTYTTAGIYEIAISGRFDSLRNASASNTSVQSVRKILSWGDGTVFEGFRNLQFGFKYATGLTEIASDTYGGLSNNMYFEHCFGFCYSLTEIPVGLFDNCTNVTSFNSCFGFCYSLTEIPVGLFDNCTNVTSFNYCFQDCTSLTAIPAGLFDNCTNVTSFYYCFQDCTSLTAIPAGLFDNCTNVTDFNYCFQDCTSLTAIPAGLFDNCTNVTSFYYCFGFCYSLTEIPAGLFDNCTNVTSFNSCFRNCYSLTAIPAGLFDNCTNVTDFNYCFWNCNSLTAIPAGLFDNCTNVTSFNSCFGYCTSLTAIPAGLFDNCPNVTGFNSCFYHCNNLVLRGDEFTLSTLTGRTINFSNCFKAQSTSSTHQKVGTAPELWNAGLSASSTTTDCFRNRTLLTNYSSIPSAWL